MYSIPRLNTVGFVLARSKITNVQLIRHRLQTINTTSNEVKSKSRFVFYATSTIITGMMGTMGLVAYSKYNPEFREFLTNHLPIADNFIKVCLFEDKELINQSKQFGGRIVCKVVQKLKSIKESIGGQSDYVVDKSIEQIKSISKSFPTATPLISNYEDEKPKKKPESQHIKNKPQNDPIQNNIDLPNPKAKSQELSPALVILPPVQYNLEELEIEILKEATLSIDALKTATEAIKEYSENIYNLIENSTEKIDPNLNVKLQQLEDKKNVIYIKSCEDANKYKKDIAEKQKLLNNSTFERNPDELAKTLHRTNEALKELTNTNAILEYEVNKLDYIQKYKSNVNEAQANLIEEFESIFPGSDITQHKINIKNNDFDIFLLYALKKLNYYQDKLSRQEATLDRKVNNAMSADFLNVETINEMNSRLNSEIYQLDEQFRSQLNEYNIKVDQNLQKQLNLHTQAHANLVTKAVDFTKEEFENRVRHELSVIEKLERDKYQTRLDTLKSDLQNVVNNLKEQARKEKQLFANQAIWETGEFLNSSLASYDNERSIDIKIPINTIKQLGESNAMVKQIVNAVPPKALENGVLSKGQLKDHFNQVEKRVYQTALIPDNNFNLPLMMFSYLASLFVFRHSHISPDEVNNEKFDPLELNTYEIVERARYCVDRDDLLQALRYLNLLTGCSRVVAKEWMKEATVFLETKQAIDLLMSYATVKTYSTINST